MASITLRNLDEVLKFKLRHRAKRKGTTMADELRKILSAALLQEPVEPNGKNLSDAFAGIREALADAGVDEFYIPGRGMYRSETGFVEVSEEELRQYFRRFEDD